MIHLICGPIGAGKTTVAHRLAEQHNAIRFSEDEWLSELFVSDAPEGLLDEPIHVVGAWAGEKYQRCRGQIWLICKQLLSNNISVVLDGASANREQRDLIKKKADTFSVGFQLYYVTSDTETRRKRVFDRNVNRGDTYSIEVTPEIFDYTESYFQPPVGDELTGTVIIET